MSSGASPADAYRDLPPLLPKLARPGWVKMIGVPVRPVAPIVVEEDPQAKKRRLKREHKKRLRFLRALRHEHTRVRVAA